MEVMNERNYEELSDVDLVPRKSRNGISHHTLSDFDGPIDGPEGLIEFESKSNGERVEIDSRSASEEEEEEVVGERVYGDESLFGGSHGNGVTAGSETTNGSTMEHQLSDFHPAENKSDHIVEDTSSIQRSSYHETNRTYVEFSKTEITTTFSTSTSKTSYESHGSAANGYSNVTLKPDESAVLKEAEDIPDESAVLEEAEVIPEFDVEKVLHTQETHDLFCPNCNSCITKRVILRRRKRKIQEISPGEENQEIVIPEPVQVPSPPETERIEEYVEDTREGAFRCLSCFSIFIPIGRGFKLFSFGGRGSKETVRDALLPITSGAASVPAVVIGETGEEQRAEVVSVQEQIPLNNLPEALPEQVGEQEDSMAVHADIEPQLTKVDSMALQAEQTLPTKFDADGGSKLSDAYDTSGAVIAGKEAIEGQELEILILKDEAPAVPSILAPQNDVMGIEKIDTGKKVVSVVNEPGHTVVSMTLTIDNSPATEPLLPPETDTGTAPAALAAAGGGDPQLDIVKCVVYGGLLESITSLSVVTSAAGANAKTLNIVALGAANMFGGLFILAHNLRVFKQDTSNERYEEVLGRPGHFTFHSTIAVISYIVFGLMPPVIYGFTFRESDNRDYKLIAVALASLLCILLLAFGKAYARTHPRAYRKTIMYYVSLWVMVCGVSYAAGELFDFVLQKLGLFKSSSSAAMAVGEVRPLNRPWVSY